MYNTDSKRWQAVQNRDRAASTSFVYAVISTKIYCRPACPSRTARRANVHFYDTANEAVAAGYRPCLRCKPDQATSDLDNERAPREAVRRACEYIVETKGQAKFPDVAKHVGLSTRYLYGLFKTVLGTTPVKYATGLKLDGMTQGPSETTSTISGAGSPFVNDNTEPGFDVIDWNEVADPMYLDFAIPQMDPQVSLTNSDVCNDYSLAAVSSDQFLAVNDWFKLMWHDQSNGFIFEPYKSTLISDLQQK